MCLLNNGMAHDMATQRSKRQLCVILAADVAGYSRLMSADEDGTLTVLTAHRRGLIDPAVAKYAGRMVKTAGDGCLAAFASVLDAVQCALAIQQGMAKRNRAVPQERRLEFRIGLNLGDVICQDGDLYGNDVNIAARLEALAEPGGICLAASVHDQVHGKLAPVRFEDLGAQDLKNIAHPVRVYRAVLGPAETVVATARPQASRPSVARRRRDHRRGYWTRTQGNLDGLTKSFGARSAILDPAADRVGKRQ